MEKEFNLSEKITLLGTHINFLRVNDVKEFIGLLKGDIDIILQKTSQHKLLWRSDFFKAIDKRAGDKLS